jgi:hypothetical protein
VDRLKALDPERPIREADIRAFPPDVRYMDDILILAQTRWSLRRAAATVNQVLAALVLEKHPDKTFINRIRLLIFISKSRYI